MGNVIDDLLTLIYKFKRDNGVVPSTIYVGRAEKHELHRLSADLMVRWRPFDDHDEKLTISGVEICFVSNRQHHMKAAK